MSAQAPRRHSEDLPPKAPRSPESAEPSLFLCGVYPMLMYSRALGACLNHSSLFKVNVASGLPLSLVGRGFVGRGLAKGPGGNPAQLWVLLFSGERWQVGTPPCGSAPPVSSALGTGCRNSTTSVLTATALVYTLGAGITAGAGTRLVLQSLLAEGFEFCSFQWPATVWRLALVFVVTTSPCRQGVIYAPAAFLGSGSRFSGSLSGIEP